ncbi:tRNA preQ1(34) S-adenosylmethionine ribosyltransferase-isomerase QueA [Synechococcus sp. RSCCF101]|nr:tRNA preQ1(34) S-adenosylmethionine ribosyltransferase-isomerase QueA [Synechococcus sp. RSCCF101]
MWDLISLLNPGDLMVVNDTRVLQARLRVRRSSGGEAELLLLEPRGEGRWLCLARPARRMRIGDRLMLHAPAQEEISLTVVGEDPASGGRVVAFPSGYDTAATIEDLLRSYGEAPLPPYIHRHDPADTSRYQTRYARRPGAVAAPTAGLHFSDALLAELGQRGVAIASVTLHVGLGTFRPIEQEDLRDLRLHSEWVEVPEAAVASVEACRARGGRVFAIGTTSVRALEGAAAAAGGALRPYQGPVDLVIQPGFRFQVVQGLLTNFHLPRSSLLLLVSALIGRPRLLALYQQAIAEGYRFYSYGDAMLIPPEAVLPPAS